MQKTARNISGYKTRALCRTVLFALFSRIAIDIENGNSQSDKIIRFRCVALHRITAPQGTYLIRLNDYK